MIIKLNESNSSVKFSDKYNVFSYKDIPFVKEEALHIWDTLTTGYSMIIRNDEGSSYTFEKTGNGMVRYETSKVYRTTTTKNNGDLTYADYKTEKPYNVAPEYEQANLKNAIGSGTATIKIMDKNNNVVSQIKRDFHLKYSPNLTERVIYDQETGKICLNYEGAEHIIAQALKDFDAYFEWNSITVVSKNRMRIARAIMQEFKEAGYEPTLDTKSRHKTHEIIIPDGEWSGVRISIVSHAVCNPEEQLIEIEVYE